MSKAIEESSEQSEARQADNVNMVFLAFAKRCEDQQRG